MRKVVESKATINKILLEAGFSLEVFIFLLTCGCAPKKVETSTIPVSDPDVNVQLANKEDIPKEDTYSPSLSPSETPMDASLITPEAIITPVPVQTMSQEEMNLWVSTFLQNLQKNSPKYTSFDYDKQEATKTIKMFLGDFSEFQNLANEIEDKSLLADRKEMYYYKMYNLGATFSNQLYSLSIEIIEDKTKNNITPLNIYTGYPDSFSGKDTIKLLEDLGNELYETLPVEKEINFEAKARETLNFIYDTYFNLNNKSTNFNAMHPMIKIAFELISSSLLATIDYKADLMGIPLKTNGDLILSPLQLSGEIGGNLKIDSEAAKEILTIMDGELVVVENDEEGIVLEYTPSAPSPTPGS